MNLFTIFIEEEFCEWNLSFIGSAKVNDKYDMNSRN